MSDISVEDFFASFIELLDNLKSCCNVSFVKIAWWNFEYEQEGKKVMFLFI